METLKMAGWPNCFSVFASCFPVHSSSLKHSRSVSSFSLQSVPTTVTSTEKIWAPICIWSGHRHSVYLPLALPNQSSYFRRCCRREKKKKKAKASLSSLTSRNRPQNPNKEELSKQRNGLFRGLAHCKHIHCPIKTSFPSRNNDLSPRGTPSCAEFTSPSLQHHRKMRELINLAVKPGDMHSWRDKTGLRDSALISWLQAAVSILGQLYTSTMRNEALSFCLTVPASLTVIYWIYDTSVNTSSLTRDNSRASIWSVFCHLFTGMLPNLSLELAPGWVTAQLDTEDVHRTEACSLPSEDGRTNRARSHPASDLLTQVDNSRCQGSIIKWGGCEAIIPSHSLPP